MVFEWSSKKSGYPFGLGSFPKKNRILYQLNRLTVQLHKRLKSLQVRIKMIKCDALFLPKTEKIKKK